MDLRQQFVQRAFAGMGGVLDVSAASVLASDNPGGPNMPATPSLPSGYIASTGTIGSAAVCSDANGNIVDCSSASAVYCVSNNNSCDPDVAWLNLSQAPASVQAALGSVGNSGMMLALIGLGLVVVFMAVRR